MSLSLCPSGLSQRECTGERWSTESCTRPDLPGSRQRGERESICHLERLAVWLGTVGCQGKWCEGPECSSRRASRWESGGSSEEVKGLEIQGCNWVCSLEKRE